MIRIYGVVVTLIALSSPDVAMAHSGGLNAEGCHNNRSNGTYHCHRAASSQYRLSYDAQPRVQAFRGGGDAAGGAFANCTAARAAGATPVYRGDPRYGRHLDRDNDGVGCE